MKTTRKQFSLHIQVWITLRGQVGVQKHYIANWTILTTQVCYVGHSQWWANSGMFRSKSQSTPTFKSKSTLLKKLKSNRNPNPSFYKIVKSFGLGGFVDLKSQIQIQQYNFQIQIQIHDFEKAWIQIQIQHLKKVQIQSKSTWFSKSHSIQI